VLGLRLVSIAAIILAVASPSMPLNDATMSVAFAMDASQSISPAGQARQSEWVRQALGQMRSADRSAVVTFAGNSVVTTPPGIR